MSSASFPSLHLPTFSCESAHPGEVTQQRLVARLYASVKISVNESRNGSRGTASGLPTFRELSVGQKPDPGKPPRLGEQPAHEVTLLAVARQEECCFEEVSARGPATAPCG